MLARKYTSTMVRWLGYLKFEVAVSVVSGRRVRPGEPHQTCSPKAGGSG